MKIVLFLVVLVIGHSFGSKLRFKSFEDFDNSINDFKDAHDAFLSTLDKEYGNNHRENFNQGVSSTKEATKVIVAKIIRAIAFEGIFTMTFTGTSVTECGDNYWNASYVHWFDRQMSKMAEATNVDLVVSNVAEGANAVFPYDYCIELFAGENVDVVTWEQDMMASGWGSTAVEAFIINAFKLDRKPSVLFMNPGVDRGSIETVERVYRKWFGLKGKDLRKHYDQVGFHSIVTFMALKGTDPEDQRFSSAHLRSEGKLFGNAGWHPGPYGHQLTGFQTTNTYATFWTDALSEMQTIRSSSSTIEEFEANLAKYVASVLESKSFALPENLNCDETMCLSDKPIRCMSLYEPRVSTKWELMDAIINKDAIVDLRPLDTVINSKQQGKWAIQKISPTVDKRGSASKKFILTGNKDSGQLDIKLEASAEGHVILCQVRNRRRPAGTSLWEISKFKIDSQWETFEQYGTKSGLCVWSSKTIKKGSHVLSINPTSEVYIDITHIVWN